MNDLYTPSDEEIAEAFGVEDVDDITDEMLEDVDVPDLPDTLDLSEYKSAHGAAKATARHLRHYADKDEYVTVRREESRDGHKWIVAWESGSPYEWAVWLTGSESIYKGEFYGTPLPGGEPNPQIVGFYNNENWSVECERSFILGFYPQ